MDQEIEVFQVSFNQLIDLSDGGTGRSSTNNNSPQVQISSSSDVKKKKKRPDRQLYLPAHRRRGGESNEQKETIENDSPSQPSEQDEPKKLPKRKPDLKIYVPKPRLDNIRKKSEDDQQEDEEAIENATGSSSPRKVHVQDPSKMTVTLVNEKADVNAVVNKPKNSGPKSPSSRGGKRFYNRSKSDSISSALNNSSSSIEADICLQESQKDRKQQKSPAQRNKPIVNAKSADDSSEFSFDGSKTLIFERSSKSSAKSDDFVDHNKPEKSSERRNQHRYSEQSRSNQTNKKNQQTSHEFHDDATDRNVGYEPRSSGGHRKNECGGKTRHNQRNEQFDNATRKQGARIPKSHSSDSWSEDAKSIVTSPGERHVKFNLNENDTTAEQSSKARGGGIIVLPKETVGSASDVPMASAYSNRGRGRGRGRIRRASGNRTLYDPHNPHQPTNSHPVDPSAVGNKELQFYDPNECEFQQTNSAAAYDVYSMDVQQNPRVASEHPQYHIPYFAADPHTWETFYYQHEVEMHAGPSTQSRQMSTKAAEQLLREVINLDREISAIVSRRIPNMECLQHLNHIRSDLVKKCDELVCSYPDYSNKHNVEHILWKAAFYHVIEMYRKLQYDEQDDETRAQLLVVIDQGVKFYENLLKKLQMVFKFNLDDFLDTNRLMSDSVSRTVKLALLSCQRVMICLGDIARYREQSNDTCNYGKARSWYLKAQQVAPKNGKPYNQLAILAVYTRRKLDAVYYYIRSLSASNPFLSAREGLMSLFDEARKKAEAKGKKTSASETGVEELNVIDKHRTEIWIGANPVENTKDDDVELNSLIPVELNKKFVLSFLHIHGKLFTKIGMETFTDTCGGMLEELRLLLQHSPCPVGNTRLLQLMVINMFMIENTALRDSRMETDFRSVLQEQALQVGLYMFSLLVERCVQLFKVHLSSPDYPRYMMSDELHNLFPSIKIWCDWMLCHHAIWNPPMKDGNVMPGVNVWMNVSDLCNVLKDIDISHVKFYTTRKEGCDAVVLPEDVMMAGFVPLLSAPQDTAYVHATVDKDIAKDCFRIERLQLFADYLCGIEPPVLTYNVKFKQYEPAVDVFDTDSESDASFSSGTTQSEDEDDVIVEENDEDATSTSHSHVGDLRAKKAELVKKVQEKEKYRENVQSVLDSANRPMVLRIIPVFLVPDTNGFISYLADIKKLVDCGKYTIIVPLVVINELDGLALGAQNDKYSNAEHAAQVRKGAKAAVSYLQTEFQTRNSRIKAMTAKGNLLDTIAFRSEENNGIGNNDDVILSCCIHYCQDKARDYMPRDKDTPITLHREVVLLTADRNLRVKAHARNVPTKDIPSFLSWANIH
ncbi:telomerase-binding protein EST1A-like [Tubulanus polymorphus]|uniref:telomerase-binding protein EST1A-like n=1 Tax=Tubulanus polymorphus TaxID=672921 RepID=UPI003DA4E4C0